VGVAGNARIFDLGDVATPVIFLSFLQTQSGEMGQLCRKLPVKLFDPN
jgi:hypothetical protein